MSYDLRIVVIGNSLRPEAAAVVRTGIAIARAMAGRAELVHAYTPLRHHMRVGGTGADLGSWRAMHERLSEELHQFADELGVAEDSDVGWHAEPGPPHEVLNGVASALDADLIVVGPAERWPLHRGALGSAVDRLLRTTSHPVLVVRGELEVPPPRVLAAVDLSTPSLNAFRCAELLLDAMGGESSLEVVTVLDPEELQRPLSQEQLDEFVTAELRRLVSTVSEADLAAADFTVLRGEPRSEIAQEIERRRADLVVVGSHGRARSDRFEMIGRVAYDLARSAPASVLVVPPAAAYVAGLSVRHRAPKSPPKKRADGGR